MSKSHSWWATLWKLVFPWDSEHPAPPAHALGVLSYLVPFLLCFIRQHLTMLHPSSSSSSSSFLSPILMFPGALERLILMSYLGMSTWQSPVLSPLSSYESSLTTVNGSRKRKHLWWRLSSAGLLCKCEKLEGSLTMCPFSRILVNYHMYLKLKE